MKLCQEETKLLLQLGFEPRHFYFGGSGGSMFFSERARVCVCLHVCGIHVTDLR